MQIGPQLKAARMAKGLSLRGLASAAGVSPSLLCDIEKGQANPSVATLFQIAEALQMPMTALFSAPEATAATEKPPESHTGESHTGESHTVKSHTVTPS